MEDGLIPCQRASEQMAAYDALPAEMRDFIARYPRGLKATDAAQLLRVCGGDIEDAMHEITCLLPTRRAA